MRASHSECLARVREWQKTHQSKRKWKDVGYNALICQHGRAIEGRGLGFSGSHSPGVNTSHYGVQFMVGGADLPPSEIMLARARQLRADLKALSPYIRRDWSHKDDPKASTECAGLWIASWVHSGGPTRTPGYPSPKPPTTREEDDMPYTQDQIKDLTGSGVLGAQIGRTGVTVAVALDRIYRAVGDPDALAAKVAAAVQVKATGVDPQVIEDAVKQALREGVSK